MRETTICMECGSKEIDYIGKSRCFCHTCNKETETKDKIIENPYERTRRAVYATGNRWAIENFNATH